MENLFSKADVYDISAHHFHGFVFASAFNIAPHCLKHESKLPWPYLHRKVFTLDRLMCHPGRHRSGTRYLSPLHCCSRRPQHWNQNLVAPGDVVSAGSIEMFYVLTQSEAFYSQRRNVRLTMPPMAIPSKIILNTRKT